MIDLIVMLEANWPTIAATIGTVLAALVVVLKGRK